MFERLNRFRNLLGFGEKNSMSLPLGKEFLKYGNRRMMPDWSEVLMTDKDQYSGYMYAAIRNRANGVARIGHDKVRTEANQKALDHPYLNLIRESDKYSEFSFWTEISTYLDLEGVYYLMVIRNANQSRTGQIKYARLLNPYNITPILDPNTLEVAGYKESRDGYERDIPLHMIIPIRELNPFKRFEPFAMTDAAKEGTFTLKTAGDYTRNALRNNINAPGLISTGVILPDPQFQNFMERVRNHTKGEPLFSNGTGAIDYKSMESDITKASLDKLNEMNRDMIFATAGVSKTIMGIEQSGTTRETARVQKDLMTEVQLLPRVQLILDALNLDYKNRYVKEYESNKALLVVDSPVESDHDSESTEVDVKQKKTDLYNDLLDKGYTKEIASSFVLGEIDIDKLGEPKNPPKEDPIEDPENPKKKVEPKNKLSINEIRSLNESEVIQKQEMMLQNSVVNIEQQLVAYAINRIGKTRNEFDSETDIIIKSERREVINELAGILTTFYGIIFTIQGNKRADEREKQFDIKLTFRLNRDAQNFIKEISDKVATSHISTVIDDILVVAKEASVEGLSRQEIISKVKQAYSNDISTKRARVIARTETNRAFTTAQFSADSQFVKQNDLVDRAYKKWVTRSSNPCVYCSALAAEDAIPFFDNFRDLGQDVNVGTGKGKKTLSVNFSSLGAGNAHPNCSCEYELIIRKEKKSE